MKMFAFRPKRSFFVLCLVVFFSPFLLSTRHLFVVLFTNRSPELRIESQRCAPPVSYLCACIFSLRSSVIIIFLSPFVLFDDFIAPNVFTIMSGVILLFINGKTQPQRETPWSSHRLFSEALCRLLSLRFNFHTVYFLCSNQDRR